MAGAPPDPGRGARPLVTHAGERGAHVSPAAAARPHPPRSEFGAAGGRASSLPEAGPTPPLRPGWLPAAPPTSYPRPPRRGAVPAGRRLTRRAVPQFPAAASPRHGPGPRRTMAAARHSTLDFKLGARGEGARPPPARSPPPPGGLGPGGAHAAGRTMRAAGPCAPAAGGGRAAARAALRPGRCAGPGGAVPGAPS